MKTYSYVLLRYIHDLSVGEFVNVGVVAYEPAERVVAFRFKHSVSRVTSFFPGVKAKSFKQQISMLEKAFSEVEKGRLALVLNDTEDARKIATSVLVDDDSALRWSELKTGITKDVHQTVDALFDRMVNRYDEPKSSHTRRTDQDIWSSFSKFLPEPRVVRHFTERRVETSDDEVVFQHAWKNGKWHCLEPLSFDLSAPHSIKEKVHKCFGQMASMQTELANHKIYFLLARPEGESLSDEYAKAKNILSKLPLEKEIVEEDQFHAFGERISKDIESHEAGH